MLACCTYCIRFPIIETLVAEKWILGVLGHTCTFPPLTLYMYLTALYNIIKVKFEKVHDVVHLAFTVSAIEQTCCAFIM